MPKNMYVFFALSLLVSYHVVSAELAESALKVTDAVHADADRGTDTAEKNKEADNVSTATTETQTTQAAEQAVTQVEKTATVAPVAAVEDNSTAVNAELDDLLADSDDSADSEDED